MHYIWNQPVVLNLISVPLYLEPTRGLESHSCTSVFRTNPWSWISFLDFCIWNQPLVLNLIPVPLYLEPTCGLESHSCTSVFGTNLWSWISFLYLWYMMCCIYFSSTCSCSSGSSLQSRGGHADVLASLHRHSRPRRSLTFLELRRRERTGVIRTCRPQALGGVPPVRWEGVWWVCVYWLVVKG